MAAPIVALAAFALILLALVVVEVVGMADKRNETLVKYVGEEHARTLEMGRQLLTMVETFGFRLTDATLRESDDIRTVIGALTADRRSLITAILSKDPDSRVAQRFGTVEQALADAPDEAVTSKAREMLRDALAKEREGAMPRDAELVGL